MEVCINDQWGTVCDDLWDSTDATVVCDQLGYLYTRSKHKCVPLLLACCYREFLCCISCSCASRQKTTTKSCDCKFFTLPLCAGGTAYSNAHFGAGSGHIFLDDVQCTSSDNQLLECSSRPILYHNCLHSADAGVACEGKEYFKKLMSFYNICIVGDNINSKI